MVVGEMSMASVELTSAQVVELVRQLPAEAKREVLLALAGGSQAPRGADAIGKRAIATIGQRARAELGHDDGRSAASVR